MSKACFVIVSTGVKHTFLLWSFSSHHGQTYHLHALHCSSSIFRSFIFNISQWVSVSEAPNLDTNEHKETTRTTTSKKPKSSNDVCI